MVITRILVCMACQCNMYAIPSSISRKARDLGHKSIRADRRRVMQQGKQSLLATLLSLLSTPLQRAVMVDPAESTDPAGSTDTAESTDPAGSTDTAG